MNVLMVCLGNICRSPMAQGILEHKIKQHSLAVGVDSAGTASYHIGEPPDQRAIHKSFQKGIDISEYRARQFTTSDFQDFDLIFAMDESNYNDILTHAQNDQDKHKVHLILNKIYPGQNMSVPDPYYGGDDGFENVFKLLDSACDKIIDEIIYER
ncbi:MAG TPA: protein-tyrosine-phosphatase [Flavobacteriales bacterium]|nr:protein-tyrosine-phosphatase [Flavobacteriales bacterium]